MKDDEKAKTVYILGAGCSVEEGIPLINDFFKRAISLKTNKNREFKLDNMNERERFDKVLKWREEHIPNSNIEEIFSFIDLTISFKEVLGPVGDLRSLRRDLLFLISKTISKSVIGERSQNYELFKRKLTRDISIITFNWDILLDNVLINREASNNINIDYGANFLELYIESNTIKFRKTVKNNPYRILKLHGSLNWLQCENCRARYFIAYEKVKVESGKNPQCPKCLKQKIDSYNEPLIVPPTFQKQTNLQLIADIWEEAKKDLTDCEKIIIVGYSFPDNDIHTKLFIQSCISINYSKNNNRPIRIIVINHKFKTKDKMDFQDHYEAVFNNVKDKITLEFLYLRFSEFVRR